MKVNELPFHMTSPASLPGKSGCGEVQVVVFAAFVLCSAAATKTRAVFCPTVVVKKTSALAGTIPEPFSAVL